MQDTPAELALAKIRAALDVQEVSDSARVVGVRAALEEWELSQ